MWFEQCALHPSSCFSFRCRVDWRREESVTSGRCVPVGLMRSHSLVLIIVRPSIHLPQDWYASGCRGKPRHAPRARQPARACLCSAGTALRSHQDKPDLTRGRLSWLMIPPRIFSHSNLAPLDCCAVLCVGVHVWTTVWMWQWIRNLIRSGVRIFRTEMCRCGSIHMRGSSCPPVVCGATFPKRVTSCEPTLSRLC